MLADRSGRDVIGTFPLAAACMHLSVVDLKEPEFSIPATAGERIGVYRRPVHCGDMIPVGPECPQQLHLAQIPNANSAVRTCCCKQGTIPWVIRYSIQAPFVTAELSLLNARWPIEDADKSIPACSGKLTTILLLLLLLLLIPRRISGCLAKLSSGWSWGSRYTKNCFGVPRSSTYPSSSGIPNTCSVVRAAGDEHLTSRTAAVGRIGYCGDPTAVALEDPQRLPVACAPCGPSQVPDRHGVVPCASGQQGLVSESHPVDVTLVADEVVCQARRLLDAT
mmetsp:Transcript_145978/g.254727  ORF Transcript_145978/g.254727 Transcript_145978/m.254727 type:complete len:279 (-) Transcript_145978:197-1033(-)